ncbi:MAG: methionine--tRNA ligase [Coriobacteriia bacterium]|nr:methionine--tRNA ligase [Coriobacteriia bacterium]
MTEKRSYYLTTPIYYVNAAPHLGTAYTTIAADALARYQRLNGRDVLFLTGLDEHGQKVEEAATAHDCTPREWVDRLAPAFTELWRQLAVSNDRFIRTTDADHERAVQMLAQQLYDSGDIYPGTYKGWYCVPDEAYWAESDLDLHDHHADADSADAPAAPLCPDCGRPLRYVEEQNYFFRLSKYQDWLLDYYQQHPDFIGPQQRRNEVISFVRGGLKDLSISRANVKWGVPLPWDATHTMYVWFDALINYISATGYGDKRRFAEFTRRWPANIHFVGKDIIRFHCVIWPAMLHAARLPLPERIFAHGFLLARGEKMSKSKGNATAPQELISRFGVDGYRYYFLRDVSFGTDGSISDEAMVQRYNGDLANDWGNLCSRLFNMVHKYREGAVPDPAACTDAQEASELRQIAAGLYARVDAAYEALDYAGALEAIWDLVKATNRYLENSAPWTLAKADADTPQQARLSAVLYAALEAVRIVALYTAPVLPQTSAEVCARLGLPPLDSSSTEALGEAPPLQQLTTWGALPPGAKITIGAPLFPRL